MDDPGAVGFLEGIADLYAALQHLLQRQRTFLQPVVKALALHELHHQIRGSVLCAHVVEHADVRMIQRRNDPGFALEPLLRLGIVRKMGGKNLDRYRPVQASVARAINLAHAARPERRFNFIRTESGARGKSHSCAQLYDMAAARLLCGAGAPAREYRRQKTSAQQASVIPTEFSSFRTSFLSFRTK